MVVVSRADELKGYRFPTDLILLSVRWYLRYNLSYPDLEEMLEERGALFAPLLSMLTSEGTPFCCVDFSRKRLAASRSRWAVSSTSRPFSIGHPRRPFAFLNAASSSGVKRTTHRYTDVWSKNTPGIEDYNDVHGQTVEVRKCKYLNNIVEQDHRNIKRRTRSMLGFKSF